MKISSIVILFLGSAFAANTILQDRGVFDTATSVIGGALSTATSVIAGAFSTATSAVAGEFSTVTSDVLDFSMELIIRPLGRFRRERVRERVNLVRSLVV